MTKQRRATSADVARRAGVSRATVSYVLNGRTDQAIPQATRDRVLTAAADLGYTPNVAARNLRAGSSRLVLLVNEAIPMGRNLAAIVDALAGQAEQEGRSLVLWQRSGMGSLALTLTHLAPCLTITLGSLDAHELGLLSGAGIPVLAAGLGDDVNPSYGEVPSVAQVRHLAAHGHHRIGVLSTADPALRNFAEPRIAGACNAAHALGLAPPPVATLPSGAALTVAAVTEVLQQWRRGPDPVTAVACYNDYLAAAALAAAGTMKLRVPRDLAVIGIDDEGFGRFTQPPLTTIGMDNEAFARSVWERAQRVLAGQEDAAPATPTPYSLVVRESA